MARKAVVEQNGSDVAVVLDYGIGGMDGLQPNAGARCEHEVDNRSSREGRVHAVWLPFRWGGILRKGHAA